MSDFQEIVHKLADLSVNVGLLDSVMDSYPEHVRENWAERKEGIVEWADRQIEEVQAFAEHFDT